MENVINFLLLLPRVTVSKLKNIVENINITDIEDIDQYYIKTFLPNVKISEDILYETRELYKKIIEKCKKNNIKIINYFNHAYPEKLKNIDNPPKIIYAKGNLELLERKYSLGVVGSRKPSSYGIWATKNIVEDLSNYGFCIISGMAAGIDSVAHKASLDAEGETIAVFGTPITKIYPNKNKSLYNEILEKGGLVISERSPMENTLPAFFALRNRIISGLSDGLFVTQAGRKSGTLITAKYALEQGKNVFALPGNVNSELSAGTNNLIKQGAFLVSSVSDILFEYGVDESDLKKIYEVSELSNFENKVLSIVKTNGSCHAETISSKLSAKIADVIAVLNILSIKGYLEYDGYMASIKI